MKRRYCLLCNLELKEDDNICSKCNSNLYVVVEDNLEEDTLENDE